MADFNWGLQTPGAGFYALIAPGNAAQGQDIGAIGTDKYLKSVFLYFPIGGSPSIGRPRVAVYQGGVLDNPAGASLLYDFGELNTLVDGVAGWYGLTIALASRPAIAQNTMTWIVFKDSNQSQIYGSETTPANWENFVGAAGNRDTVGISSDHTAPFEATIPGTGTLHSPTQMVNAYLVYTDESPTPPAPTPNVGGTTKREDILDNIVAQMQSIKTRAGYNNDMKLVTRNATNWARLQTKDLPAVHVTWVDWSADATGAQLQHVEVDSFIVRILGTLRERKDQQDFLDGFLKDIEDAMCNDTSLVLGDNIGYVVPIRIQPFWGENEELIYFAFDFRVAYWYVYADP